ncbi:MAG TPA: hypothetical protein PLO28_14690 [bacterium]|nr:hypothetical protein [bacterium]
MRCSNMLISLFLLLGATLLNGQELLPQDGDVVVTLGNSITGLGASPAGEEAC